jgi:hypothetical protein
MPEQAQRTHAQGIWRASFLYSQRGKWTNRWARAGAAGARDAAKIETSGKKLQVTAGACGYDF